MRERPGCRPPHPCGDSYDGRSVAQAGRELMRCTAWTLRHAFAWPARVPSGQAAKNHIQPCVLDRTLGLLRRPGSRLPLRLGELVRLLPPPLDLLLEGDLLPLVLPTLLPLAVASPPTFLLL